ncbi:unnamed protein product [Soboliphyme baturini]|uniref:G_PROTEIN_RECEP_F1_2 domain-containing protein n=1 Tax=Soboliphyme baturini TaxID=241478 RepID=A0A183IFU2_9BILA|nr:unnamed protein product [Soboliphyme baturini]
MHFQNDYWSSHLSTASLVGLYNVPVMARLRPYRHRTSITKVILNCVVILVLSSALPVLTRVTGVSSFDLLGHYGRLDWLGNFYLVLAYNLVFMVLTASSLVIKLTASVRRKLISGFL